MLLTVEGNDFYIVDTVITTFQPYSCCPESYN